MSDSIVQVICAGRESHPHIWEKALKLAIADQEKGMLGSKGGNNGGNYQEWRTTWKFSFCHYDKSIIQSSNTVFVVPLIQRGYSHD